MADKKGLDVGLIFGPPPKGGGGMMGPDNTQMLLGHDIFDAAKPVKDRIRALHYFVHACLDDMENAESDEEEAPASAKSEGSPGGY